MCYDVSNGAAKFREEVSVNLAWWHTYKFALHVVWKFFARDVFAPLFHHLFPGQHFYHAPKSLSVIVSMFQIVKLAYGNFLSAEVARVRNTGSIPAADFTFLCENAIPAVPSACLSLSDSCPTCHCDELRFTFPRLTVNCVCLVPNSKMQRNISTALHFVFRVRNPFCCDSVCF